MAKKNQEFCMKEFYALYKKGLEYIGQNPYTDGRLSAISGLIGEKDLFGYCPNPPLEWSYHTIQDIAWDLGLKIRKTGKNMLTSERLAAKIRAYGDLAVKGKTEIERRKTFGEMLQEKAQNV